MQIEYFDQSHAATNPMYGVYEFSSGFFVQVGRRDSDFFFYEFFSYAEYSDPLAAAQKMRDKVIRSKAFRQYAPGSQGRPTRTGFIGVTCDIRRTPKRRCVFLITDNRLQSDGKLAKRCFSGIQRGPWLACRQAVRLRHQIIGKRVTEKLITQRYDEVFLPNFREKLESLDLDWRRGVGHAD